MIYFVSIKGYITCNKKGGSVMNPLMSTFVYFDKAIYSIKTGITP